MKPLHVLLVEDNEGDILLITEMLSERPFTKEITVARDGKQAIDYLEDRRKRTFDEGPDIILLDINLPKKNGIEVLQHIKKDRYLKTIPVIMLSTSSSPSDIFNSYNNSANCYVTKPAEMKDYQDTLERIGDYWSSYVKLPVNNDSHEY